MMVASTTRRSLRLGTARKAVVGSILAGGGAQASLVVSGILLARLLGPENRGYLALLVVVPSVICQLGGLGFSLGLSYFIAREPRTAAVLVRTIRNPALVQVALLTIIDVGVLAVLVRGKPGAFEVAAAISLLAVPATMSTEYGLAILQGQRRFRAFNVLRILPPSVYAFCLVLFALGGFSDLAIAAGAAFITSLLLGVAILLYAVRSLPPADHASSVSLRMIVGFGARGFLGALSPIDSFRLDQLFVGLALAPAQLGIYVVGAAFANLPRFIAASIGFVAYPVIAAERGRRVARARMWRYSAFSAVLCGAITGVIILLMPAVLPWFFGSEYAAAVPIGRLIVLGAFFLSVRRVLTDAARGAGYPTIGAVAEVAGLVWVAGALLLLVPAHGLSGVALAFASSAAFSLLVIVLALATRRPREPAVATESIATSDASVLASVR